ncbi:MULTISPECIES: hypothetical protein [Acinetobacter]|uniref:hypothetical protein n=1 Tax=Acinetobacter TaxID=469 RepID=UPI000C369473|nr:MULTISPECIES: hypothetical protein [unclassified Acinetobacter]MBC69749.1 hypothetical protein [Acinetobacter sp.]|tara:strand:- start:654 stop:1202 length:549 start_codon:yes stop_codon:yes gene_type:complete
MNDFFLLNNESLPYVFVDQNIEIKQIQVKNLNRFAQFADPIKKLESYSIETITPLIEPQMLNIMGMCSLVTTISPESFNENAGQSRMIVELVLKIIEVNEAFFKKDEKETDSKDSSWFEAFAYLVKMGHRHNDILDLSYGAFLQYLKEGHAVERQQVKSYAIAQRMASGANKRDWEKYLKSL